jgi:hypothetical protein
MSAPRHNVAEAESERVHPVDGVEEHELPSRAGRGYGQAGPPALSDSPDKHQYEHGGGGRVHDTSGDETAVEIDHG